MKTRAEFGIHIGFYPVPSMMIVYYDFMEGTGIRLRTKDWMLGYTPSRDRQGILRVFEAGFGYDMILVMLEEEARQRKIYENTAKRS